jgi:hypothetical protein
LAAIAVIYCPIPWSAAFLLLAILILIFARLDKGDRTAALVVNIAFVVFAIASFEGYLGLKQLRGDGTRIEGNLYSKYHIDETLGYAPNPNEILTALKFYRDTQLYDDVYCCDAHWLRQAPPMEKALQDW